MEKIVRLDSVAIRPKDKDGNPQTKNYFNRYDTNAGTYTAFDDTIKVNEDLVQLAMRNKWVKVRVREQGKYKNFIEFLGEAEKPSGQATPIRQNAPTENIKQTEDRFTSSYEVGAPSKGGKLKVYFDPCNLEEGKMRLDMARQLQAYDKEKYQVKEVPKNGKADESKAD